MQEGSRDNHKLHCDGQSASMLQDAAPPRAGHNRGPPLQDRARREKTIEDVDRHYRRIQQGELLRQAIRAGLELKKMTVADLARAIGLRGPTSLYNFMNRQSHSLNMKTTLAIGRVLDINLTVLMDLPPVAADEDVTALVQHALRAKASPAVRDILDRLATRLLAAAPASASAEFSDDPDSRLEISYEVVAGRQRRIHLLPEAQRNTMTGVLAGREIARDAFGVRVVGDAGEPVYRAGTTLVCVPAKGHMGELVDGRRVLVGMNPVSAPRQRTLEIRQVMVEGGRGVLNRIDGQAEPIPALRVPETRLPARLRSNIWQDQDLGLSVTVMGIVSSAIIPEWD